MEKKYSKVIDVNVKLKTNRHIEKEQSSYKIIMFKFLR